MSSVAAAAQGAGKGAAKAAARRRVRRQKHHGESAVRRPGWITYAVLGIALVISAFPLYYTLLLGSSDQVTISQEVLPQLLPDASIFERFADVMGNSQVNFWLALANSVIISVTISVATVLTSTLAGFSFAKLRYPGRNALLVFVIATMAVPTQLGVIPMYILMSEIGWVGKIQAVIVPALVSAFGVFWMTQYLDSALPFELIEAARVDGASMFRTFWSIALPAARPAAAMLGLFIFVMQWTMFFWPSIILGSQNPTLPIAVQNLTAGYHDDYSLIMAGVFLVTLPLLIIFAVIGRQLVAGIMQGAVKG
ncbi:carbohydrate ABC transporter permease [Myceligenerans xiligouense]|uniref:Cellobiose ABC transporter membrane protein n=1 Tax=Myceligenerans xiligouense TaxID=253184 RepID=A0A3N4YP15_9MICO|nr:carbohydrate ABC transporter permease [Myceligenerans xiligouense]RPF21196.1 cellobiose ABC transporter membrane protein [Myceligenerans xiligouense]